MKEEEESGEPCEKCGKIPYEYDSPGKLCGKCWHEWFNEPADETDATV